MAFVSSDIDAAKFTLVRIVTGAIALCMMVSWKRGAQDAVSDWRSAFALFCYAACFSFAYLGLTAGMGALLLFCAVQVTMIAYGFLRGERFKVRQIVGFLLALVGLLYLLSPSLSAPPVFSASLMLFAGIAWGIYSLRGRHKGAPLQSTAANFVRATVFAIILNLIVINDLSLDYYGVSFAVLSGVFTSGLGYAV